MDTSVVVAARECRSTAFMVHFFLATVAIVHRITWNISFGSPNSSAKPVRRPLAIPCRVYPKYEEDERAGRFESLRRQLANDV
jgi:hypothetical protein